MSFRDDMKINQEHGIELDPPKNPLLSKRLVIDNLNQILNLLENCNDSEGSIQATERIKFLISEINSDKLKPGNL